MAFGRKAIWAMHDKEVANAEEEGLCIRPSSLHKFNLFMGYRLPLPRLVCWNWPHVRRSLTFGVFFRTFASLIYSWGMDGLFVVIQPPLWPSRRLFALESAIGCCLTQ